MLLFYTPFVILLVNPQVPTVATVAFATFSHCFHLTFLILTSVIRSNINTRRLVFSCRYHLI